MTMEINVEFCWFEWLKNEKPLGGRSGFFVSLKRAYCVAKAA
jgi:hypothetical protein